MDRATIERMAREPASASAAPAHRPKRRLAPRRRWSAAALFGALLLASAGTPGNAQNASSPPRSISDITAILDSQKPDSARIARARADADAMPAPGANDAQLQQFYFRRSLARNSVGRLAEAIEDARRAAALVKDQKSLESFRIRQYLVNLYNPEPALALGVLEDLARDFGDDRKSGRALNIYRHMVVQRLALGDLDQAEIVFKRMLAIYEEMVASSSEADRELYQSGYEADLELARGFLLDRRGLYREAEAAKAKSLLKRKDMLAKIDRWPNKPPRFSIDEIIDFTAIWVGEMKAYQGRLIEAEADIRTGLLSRLGAVGKYHTNTVGTVRQLSRVVFAQGRYEEAEKLQRTILDILRALGFADNSPVSLRTLMELVDTLTTVSRWQEAAEIFDAVEKSIADWPEERRDFYLLRRSRIQTLYRTGAVAAGVAAAEALMARERKRVGEEHRDFVLAKVIWAEGLARAGRNAEALAAFRAAIPPLAADARAGEDLGDFAATRRVHQLRDVVETYLHLLARHAGGPATAAETFALADSIRGRSVQSALAAASARIAARDPALADLVRSEQDLRMQIAAHFALLNDALAAPAAQRDERIVGSLRAGIDRLRAEHLRARRDIESRFPEYAELIDPKPATAADVQRTLRPNEALLSFYFGRERSFAWSLSKEGPVVFVEIEGTEASFGAKVAALRKALEPNAATVDDIPAFDVGSAYALYAALLKPVESAWKPAKSLIVMTNGPLGTLPLALLPTAPHTLDADAKPLFAGYRNVPWLARTHSVTVVPSAAVLRALRQLPASPATREAFVGFGDPYFSAEQAAAAARPAAPAIASRSVPLRLRSAVQTHNVASAELALLPRLPDTGDELISVARALKLDPGKVLHLGAAANEGAVKSADLSRFRIVAFATHGLLPGDLNGLTQPALALTAPSVAGIEGDGLLTMDEILTLKLDADWVVLSACNTGAGTGEGAEAATGLARAFFYAGTRAVLVTNWSVHSASAGELVSDLFQRQALEPGLARSEALRRAMVHVLDDGAFVGPDGKALFAYAHPLFWAPYSILGDGGTN
ncbi:MAG: CHAT domain-containing tetratricopeptide repeat protein [Alphaproteobacteria bacterium]